MIKTELERLPKSIEELAMEFKDKIDKEPLTPEEKMALLLLTISLETEFAYSMKHPQSSLDSTLNKSGVRCTMINTGQSKWIVSDIAVKNRAKFNSFMHEVRGIIELLNPRIELAQ